MQLDSCKSSLREQILTAFKTAFSNMNQNSAILITDDKTTKILDSCLKVHQLNDLGIGALVNLKYERERVNVPPIYFLSPTIESIKALIKDYENPNKAQYGLSVHVLFCSSIASEAMGVLKTSILCRYLKTFQEVYCDFHSLESRVYHFNRPAAFRNLYMGMKVEDELRRTAENLFSVCVSLQEDPYVRYAKDSNRASGLAQIFKDFFDQKRRLMKTFQSRDRRATLLIIDRSMDPVAPLLHELTYQSAIKDLLQGQSKFLNLPIEETKGDEKNSGAGSRKTRRFDFDKDPLWEDFRHKKVLQLCAEIPQRLRQFKDSNAVARQQLDQANSSKSNLLKSVSDIPQFQRMSKSFNFHLEITKMLLDKFKRMEFSKVANIEQSIVTGLDDQGKTVRVSTIQRALLNTFKDPATSAAVKFRLLLVYFISQVGTSEKQRNDLINAANFSAKDSKILLNLRSLGVNINAEGRRTQKPPYYNEIQMRAKELLRQNLNQSRYEPLISIFLKKLEEGTLSEGEFPFCGENPEKDTLAGNFGGRSLRKKGKLRTSDGARVIVFVVGGVCYSEIRQCYLVGKELKREIYIGSNHILTPDAYIKFLQGPPIHYVD